MMMDFSHGLFRRAEVLLEPIRQRAGRLTVLAQLIGQRPGDLPGQLDLGGDVLQDSQYGAVCDDGCVERPLCACVRGRRVSRADSRQRVHQRDDRGAAAGEPGA